MNKALNKYAPEIYTHPIFAVFLQYRHQGRFHFQTITISDAPENNNIRSSFNSSRRVAIREWFPSLLNKIPSAGIDCSWNYSLVLSTNSRCFAAAAPFSIPLLWPWWMTWFIVVWGDARRGHTMIAKTIVSAGIDCPGNSPTPSSRRLHHRGDRVSYRIICTRGWGAYWICRGAESIHYFCYWGTYAREWQSEGWNWYLDERAVGNYRGCRGLMNWMWHEW